MFCSNFGSRIKRYWVYRREGLQQGHSSTDPSYQYGLSGTEVEMVSRLYLGGTFYLLEIRDCDSNSTYALESEGHGEGFSFAGFFKILNNVAFECDLGDCKCRSEKRTNSQGATYLRPNYFLSTKN